MRRTVDGFPIQNNINFLPTKPDLEMNKWSFGKTVKIRVADFYLNPRWVVWKGMKIQVADYGFFVMVLKSWIAGNARESRAPMSKEEALDFMFEVS